MITAVAVAILPGRSDGDDMETDTAILVALDPTAEEERDAIATLCIAFSFGKVQGETAGDVCFLELSSGSCEEDQVRLRNVLAVKARLTSDVLRHSSCEPSR